MIKMIRRAPYLYLLYCFLVLVVAVWSMTPTRPARADGVITVPVNNAPTSWKIAYVVENTGLQGAAAGVTIHVVFLNAGSAVVQTTLIASSSPAELNSYLGQMETAVPGEPAGVTLAARAQRRRMRMTKWIVDNAKLTNITPE